MVPVTTISPFVSRLIEWRDYLTTGLILIADAVVAIAGKRK